MNLSSYGLILDIIGVLILFYTGLPIQLPEMDDYIERGELTPEQKRKNRFQKLLAYLGLVLVLLGFILQLVGGLTK